MILPQTASMTTRDGVKLDADVYRPEQAGDFPVLLMRQPYGRQIASTICYAHPAWYAARGYIVVIQDVRGRGTSEGVFRLLENEAGDGADAVAWAAALPGSTGVVGMYGFSYQGVTQLLAAGERPAALKAVAPAMIGWDMREDWAYENDAFCLSPGMSWAIQLTAETARLAGDLDAYRELFAASRGIPLNDAKPARPGILDRHAKYVSHYFDWLDQPKGAPYWQAISPASRAEALTQGGPPALFVDGWYDPHMPAVLSAYRAYEASDTPARLIVGPWAHFPWGRRLGGVDFGEAAVSPVDELQVRWFDHWLKGVGETPMSDAPVRLFDMGTRAWRDLEAWPAASETWTLDGGERVAMDEREGVLTPGLTGRAGADPIVHDPWRPVTTLGGVFGFPGGPLERTALDAKPEVLTYTTAPLTEPLSLAGVPTVALTVAADAPSIDLSCILSRVTADGRSFLLTEGYRHFAATPEEPVSVPLRPTCMTLQPGERLRLSIAGAAFPNYPVNPGTGTRPVDARLGEGRIITLTLLRDGAGSCRLMLPVAP